MHNVNHIFNPIIWGPHYWFVLYTIALSYPAHINDCTKKKYYDFITNLPLFLPVSDIGGVFSKFLDAYPVTPYLDSRESFSKWVHFIHNKINNLLVKEEISYNAALESYFAEYRPKPIYLSEKIKWKKFAIVGVFIFICLLLIYIYW